MGFSIGPVRLPTPKDIISNSKNAVESKIDSGIDSAADRIGKVQDTASVVKDRVEEKANDVGSAVKDRVEEKANDVGSAVKGRVEEKADDAASALKHRAIQTATAFDARAIWERIPGNDLAESVAETGSLVRDSVRDKSVDVWGDIPGNDQVGSVIGDALDELPFNNSIEASARALAGETDIQLDQDATDAIKADPGFIEVEEKLVAQIEQRIAESGELGPEGLTIPLSELDPNLSVELGGERGSLNPLSPESAATWEVAGNDLTWVLRHAALDGTAHVSQSGEITIDYQISDVLDLRPGEGRNEYYNAVTTVTGALWHDVLGAEESRITGDFSTNPQTA